METLPRPAKAQDIAAVLPPNRRYLRDILLLPPETDELVLSPTDQVLARLEPNQDLSDAIFTSLALKELSG